jgi:hypothetical protein
VALLADETMPAETRESGGVRAMVFRNTSSLNWLIDEVLGEPLLSYEHLTHREN